MGKKKLKIVFLSFYSGEVYRGVETYVNELANRLVGNGYEVVVYQNGKPGKGATYKTVSINLKVNWSKKSSYTPLLSYWSFLVRRFTKVSLKDLDKDTDIVVATNGQWQSILCKLWCKRNDSKLVISGQSGPGIDDRINLWTFPNAFVGLTKYQTGWAKRVNPFVRLATISNGVDLDKFSAKGKKIVFGLPKPIVLYVGALDEWKRHHLATEAVSKLNKVSLISVGKGDREKELLTRGKELLGDRYKIASYEHNRMPRVYRSANVFTYPTVSVESFGIAMVEAMASGLPVVANDDPIRREIVGDAGLFIDPKDTEGYVKALQKALSTEWGNKPRKQAEKFNWDRIAEKYIKLFEEIIR